MKYPPLAIKLSKNTTHGNTFHVLEQCKLEITPTCIITIPAGYISDGASVPRFFWRLLSPSIYNTTLTPSVAHDYLYDCKPCDRKTADRWYRSALIDNGYPAWKTNATYLALRTCGWSHWN